MKKLKTTICLAALLLLSGSLPAFESRNSAIRREHHIVVDGGIRRDSSVYRNTAFDRNSVDAVEAAIKEGYRFVKVDVVLAADGTLVLNRGFQVNVKRYKILKGLSDIRQMTASDVSATKSLVFRRSLSALPEILKPFEVQPGYAPKTVLTLEPNLNSDDDIQRFVSSLEGILSALPYTPALVVLAENPKVLMAIKKHLPSVERALKVGGPFSLNYWKNRFSKANQIVAKLGLQYIYLDAATITSEKLTEWTRAGVQVVAHNVDNGSVALTLRDRGIARFLTDDPKEFISEATVAMLCKYLLKKQATKETARR